MAGTARSYAYNGDGLLRSRTQGAATQFLWDPSSSPSRLLKQGGDHIVYGLGPLYVVKADATTLTFARDGSKNVRAEVSSAGVATAAFRYRAYGQLAQSTTSGPAYLGLASQLIDPSGLYYMRARWYEPVTGRFITRDPLQGQTESPASLNAFAYASANPVRFNDPTGYCGPLTPLCLAAIVASPALAAFAQRVGPAAANLGARALERGYTVYQAVDRTGRVIYTGITNDFARRASEQVAERGIEIQRISSRLTDLTRIEARAIEQFRLAQTGWEGTLNRINSISQLNPMFDDLMQLADDLLQAAASPSGVIDDVIRLVP